MGRAIHVAVTGNNQGDGQAAHPLKTIGAAARLARPGDRVIVHGGEYREWVKPPSGGTSSINRITYEAAPGEVVVIKGSERVENWELVEGSVWKTVISNTVFGDYNPYQEEIYGDWFIDPLDWRLHTGEVYLNGKSFYEARSLAKVKNPMKREQGFNPFWTKKPEPILHPEDTIYQWYAEVSAENTIIYANFHDYDPNQELTEINVRKCCFYPDKTGINFITVSGFEMAHAACPYTPPTADQPGLLGVNWSKGWIIENNCIHDAKCSGISIGKEASTGHNQFSQTFQKPGYQYQMEAVFKALQIGWSKETIGSHIIRNNTIYDCGQNAIVGHMGGVFSKIYQNHIFNIAVKHEWYGYEIAGIKLHAAIDVQIYRNYIHNCTLGIWLDWQAQGTRISKNLLLDNDRDLFVEVTHGPHVIDNNILGSYYNLDNIAQGGAYINNLCCGTMRREPVLNRSTPYHFPHSTQPAGTTFVYSGDDRWYQNIFLGNQEVYTEQSTSGTYDYNGSPTTLLEYTAQIADQMPGDQELYVKVKQPVYINRNMYLRGARAFDQEVEKYQSEYDPQICFITEGDRVYLEIMVSKEMLELRAKLINSADLGMVRIVEAAFENPDGSEIVFDTDYHGKCCGEGAVVGPFADLVEGKNRILLWG